MYMLHKYNQNRKRHFGPTEFNLSTSNIVSRTVVQGKRGKCWSLLRIIIYIYIALSKTHKKVGWREENTMKFCACLSCGMESLTILGFTQVTVQELQPHFFFGWSLRSFPPNFTIFTSYTMVYPNINM